MVTLNFYDSNGNEILNLTQWDLGQVVYVPKDSISTAPIFHFYNKSSQEAIPVESEISGDYIVVDVPNILLQEPYHIGVTMVDYTDETNAVTIGKGVLCVIPKTKPLAYEYVENIKNVFEEIATREVDNRLDEFEQTYLQHLDDGSPKGIFTSVAGLSGKENGIYIYNGTTNTSASPQLKKGFIYFWNGTNISDPIIQYQSESIADGSVGYDLLSEGLKAAYDEFTNNDYYTENETDALLANKFNYGTISGGNAPKTNSEIKALTFDKNKAYKLMVAANVLYSGSASQYVTIIQYGDDVRTLISESDGIFYSTYSSDTWSDFTPAIAPKSVGVNALSDNLIMRALEENRCFDDSEDLDDYLETEYAAEGQVVVVKEDGKYKLYLLQPSGNNELEPVQASAGCYIGENLPNDLDPDIDYYIGSIGDGFVHYRLIVDENNPSGVAIPVGGDSYSKTETYNRTAIDAIVSNLQTTIENNKGYYYTFTYGVAEINGVVTQNVFQLWRYANADEVGQSGKGDIIKSTVIQGGSGNNSSSTMKITRNTLSPLVVSPTDNVIISLGYENTIGARYEVKKGSVKVASGDVLASDSTILIDLTSVTTNGYNTFDITITDDNFGIQMLRYTVNKINIRIETNYNDATYVSVGRNVTFTYTPFGNISKTIHYKIDNTETTETVTDTGVPHEHVISAQTHGAHLFEIWATASVNGSSIESEHIYKDIIWYSSEPDPTTGTVPPPVIGCNLRHGTISMTQYDVLKIPYTVYDPSDANPTITLSVDGDVIDSRSVDSPQNEWWYRGDDTGSHTLTIACGSVSVDITVNVVELNIDAHAVTTNLDMDFNPTGKSNASSNRIWSDSNYQMTVSENFDWENGGYQTDENGHTYFCIKAGTRASFNYYMFPNDMNDNPLTNGADLKIIFKTENVQNPNAVWFTNVESSTNKGIQLGAHYGWLKTNEAIDTDESIAGSDEVIYSTNSYLYMPYSEDDKIELDVCIAPLGNNTQSYAMSYEDGVPGKAYVYSSSSQFYQATPQPIVIGSDDCDVRVYRMKLYSGELSTEQILENYIADAGDSSIMLDRYQKNSIYYNSDNNTYSPFSRGGNNVLTPEGLAQKCPNLKVLKLRCPTFTKNKNTFIKNSSLQCIHVNGDPLLDNWLFDNGYHSGQGTTSDSYGDAGRNVDFIFNADGEHNCVNVSKKNNYTFDSNYVSTLTLGYDGESGSKTYTCLDGHDVNDFARVSLTRTSVPNNFFNFKVNIASSENANNALLQKRYNDYLPYETLAQSRTNYQPVYTPTQSQLANYYEKTNGVFAKTADTEVNANKKYYTVANWNVKNDMEFVPAVLFIQEYAQDEEENPVGHQEFSDTNWHFYAIGNLGDSKKTDYTRAYDPNDINEFTIEFSKNDRNNSVFQTGVYLDGSTRVVESVNDTEAHNFIYPILPSEWNENNKRYYTLYNEPFDGDNSFEPRYACCGDYRDGKFVNSTHGQGATENERLASNEAQLLLNEGVWRAFYRWVITSTDSEFVNELDQWCVKDSMAFWYVYTHNFTMMDNRAKNTFWHFAKTGTYKAVTHPAAELLHIYCEKDGNNYVPTTDSSIVSGKTYYTQYAFDMWSYDNDTALGIKC